MKQYLQSVLQKMCNVLKISHFMPGYSYISFINRTGFEVLCLTVVDKCNIIHFVVTYRKVVLRMWFDGQ
jgi:hypothetical protein